MGIEAYPLELKQANEYVDRLHMTCKECRYFIQGERKSGTCEKIPFRKTKRGGIQEINGNPRKFVIYWSHMACKMFEKGGD